jgi:hypothetical protein
MLKIDPNEYVYSSLSCVNIGMKSQNVPKMYPMLLFFRTARTVDADMSFEPSEILLKPLRKRFRFHFQGKMKTNNLVRPEWYLQQVENKLPECLGRGRRDKTYSATWAV